MKNEEKGKVKKKFYVKRIICKCAGKDKRRKSRKEQFANLYDVVQD